MPIKRPGINVCIFSSFYVFLLFFIIEKNFHFDSTKKKEERNIQIMFIIIFLFKNTQNKVNRK
jgi:hypothetical protein